VSDFLLVGMQSWLEIKHDFGANWLIYLSMPLVAAFVGWSTKIVALEMLYRPLEFKGIGPIGWQGIVPRRAGKVGSKTIELLTANLLKPEELLERIDAGEAIEALRDPLLNTVDIPSTRFRGRRRTDPPGAVGFAPRDRPEAIQSRIQSQAAQIVENLLDEMKTDLGRYVDLQFLAVTTLVRNKDKLVKLMRSASTDAMAFVRRSGIYFGLVIGSVQMVAWALFKNRYCSSWPLLAGAGVTVARPRCRVLARLGKRDLVPRVPGRWRFLVLTCRSSGVAWWVALTMRSSGRVRVTPSRRRAVKPWARLPITVAAAWCRVTFS